MEDAPPPKTTDASWADDFARKLNEQRGLVEEYLARQRDRLDQAQTALAERAQQISEELDRDSARRAKARQELDERSQELDRKSENLGRLHEELQARQAEWETSREQAVRQYRELSEQVERQQQELDKRHQELEQRRSEIETAEATLHRDQQAFALAREERQAEIEHVGALREQLESRIAELAQEREQLATDRAHLEAQRSRIAQEFKAQRAAHLKEIERRRAELGSLGTSQPGDLDEQLQGIARERAQLEADRDALQAEEERLAERQQEVERRRGEIDAAEAKVCHDQQALNLARGEHQAEVEHVAALRGQLEARIAELANEREELTTGRARLEAQRRRIAQEFNAQRAAHLKEIERRREEVARLETGQVGELKRQWEDVAGQRDRLEQEVQQLRSERGQLIERLTETEARLTEAESQAARAASQEAGAASDEELQRRYEMALEDLRELKARNAELERQATQAAATAGTASGGVLNWEAEKQRILAALEADSEEPGEEAKAERLEIEAVIQKTDHAVAEKDRQIAELHELLAAKESHPEGVVVGAAAMAELLDQDAIVQEERENLRRLQAEWEEKLRQAEVDLSVERAKIARQRADIEEKLHALGKRDDGAQADGRSADAARKSERSGRNRWLARLGLIDPQEP